MPFIIVLIGKKGNLFEMTSLNSLLKIVKAELGFTGFESTFSDYDD
jgi:hypothetical protein